MHQELLWFYWESTPGSNSAQLRKRLLNHKQEISVNWWASKMAAVGRCVLLMLSWEIYHTHTWIKGQAGSPHHVASHPLIFIDKLTTSSGGDFRSFFDKEKQTVHTSEASVAEAWTELRGWPEVHFSHINLWTALGLNGSMSHWRKKHKNNTEDDTVFSFRAHVGSRWQINGEIKSPFWGFVDRPPIKPCTSSDLLPSVFTEWNMQFFQSSESIFSVLCLAN